MCNRLCRTQENVGKSNTEFIMEFKKVIKRQTTIRKNDSYEAEGLEIILRRIQETKEPIGEGKPIIYTDKKDGVLPGYNIRTDRFEVMRMAAEKMSKAEASKIGKSENVPTDKEEKTQTGPSETEQS